MVVLSNIVQEPTSAYTIIDDGDNLPKILKFTSALVLGKRFMWYIMVLEHIPENLAPRPVGINELEAGLKTFPTDTFTGDGNTAAYTLSETPTSASSVMVFVDGILQKVINKLWYLWCNSNLYCKRSKQRRD